MASLRRFRALFAAIAIIFSPGGITPWLQLAHACPPEISATMAMDMAGQDQMAGMDHRQPASDGDESGDQTHHLQHCICVGACSTFATPATAASQAIAVIPAEFRTPAVVPQATRPASAPQHSHPFAQAPPLS